MKNPYVPVPLEISKIVVENDAKDIKTFRLTFLNKQDEENFKYLPGQFAELSIFGKDESPIGIASSPTQKGCIEFTVQKAGVVTSMLHSMEVGNVMGVRGPFGNAWPIDYLEGKNVVITGGGFAFSTLRSLVNYMSVTVICGPPAMIRFTLQVFFKLVFSKENIYTSLEMRMKCGIGKCGRCNVGSKYVCKDGPVFSQAELDRLTKEY